MRLLLSCLLISVIVGSCEGDSVCPTGTQRRSGHCEYSDGSVVVDAEFPSAPDTWGELELAQDNMNIDSSDETVGEDETVGDGGDEVDSDVGNQDVSASEILPQDLAQE